MSLNLVLCENLSLPSKCICKWKREKKDKSKVHTETIIQDVNRLLIDSDFEREYICTHILNKLVQLTKSEYGLLMHVKECNGDVELHAHGITNMAWNSSSRKFFESYIDTPLVFKNIDNMLFGDVFSNKEVIIHNDYSKDKRSILPKGHPPIRRFMGIPILIGEKPIMILGVCNKIHKFKKKDALQVKHLMNILAYLFIQL